MGKKLVENEHSNTLPSSHYLNLPFLMIIGDYHMYKKAKSGYFMKGTKNCPICRILNDPYYHIASLIPCMHLSIARTFLYYQSQEGPLSS